MSRKVRIVLGVAVIGLIAIVMAGTYILVRGGSGEASRSIEDYAAAQATGYGYPTTAPAQASGYVYPTDAAAYPADATATPVATQAVTAPPVEAGSTGTVFRIVPDQSEARFEIGDVRNGQSETVIGRTKQLAGQMVVDFDHPAQSKLGPVVVNLRTLATDIALRDNVIRGEILQSAQDQFEFGQFKPTSLAGLPDQVTLGEPFTFKITGDLVLRGISNQVTFDANVTPVSNTQLKGTASAVVRREQYGLNIPSIPFVASVEDAVKLHLDFVATTA